MFFKTFDICKHKFSKPPYAVKKCRINRFDCRRLWKYNRNLMGTCLELDPSTLMIQMPKTKKVSLGFTFGVNISGNYSSLFVLLGHRL